MRRSPVGVARDVVETTTGNKEGARLQINMPCICCCESGFLHQEQAKGISDDVSGHATPDRKETDREGIRETEGLENPYAYDLI